MFNFTIFTLPFKPSLSLIQPNPKKPKIKKKEVQNSPIPPKSFLSKSFLQTFRPPPPLNCRSPPLPSFNSPLPKSPPSTVARVSPSAPHRLPPLLLTQKWPPPLKPPSVLALAVDTLRSRPSPLLTTAFRRCFLPSPSTCVAHSFGSARFVVAGSDSPKIQPAPPPSKFSLTPSATPPVTLLCHHHCCLHITAAALQVAVPRRPSPSTPFAAVLQITAAISPPPQIQARTAANKLCQKCFDAVVARPSPSIQALAAVRHLDARRRFSPPLTACPHRRSLFQPILSPAS